MAPTTLLANVVLLWAGRQIRAIIRAVPLFGIPNHWDKVVEAGMLRFGSFFAAWFLGCFALATIASVIHGVEDESQGEAWISDRHQRAREHLGGVFVAALVTFCALLIGMALWELVQDAAIRLVGWRHFSRFNYGAALIGVVVVASILSWLGMAIPLIVGRGIAVWTALKRSVELSSGYEGALLLLVVESIVGSYFAWYATYGVTRFLASDSVKPTAWYSWGVYGLAVLVTAAVEPPLFIGLSLLADPERLNASSLPASQHPSHV